MSSKAKATIKNVQTLSCSASWRNYYFVKITTEDGIVGWSEFDENFGSPGVSAVIEKLSSRLIGQSAMHHEHIYQDLRCVTRPGSGGVVGQAIGALENALLDAKAKTLDVPCYDLLGGKVRDEFRVYWSHCVSYRTRAPHYLPAIENADGTRQIAREVGEKGFSALKTNIFRYENGGIQGWSPGFGRPHAPERNIERNVLKGLREHLLMMREAAGPDIDILLDLNFNARTEGYVRILREIADLDLFWIEIDTLDPQALAYIRSQSRHPIASCETLIGLQQFLPFFQAQAIDVAIIDTAGRLQTKSGLMDELAKIRRSAVKPLAAAEGADDIAEVLLVLDATTGQNGLVQASAFIEAAGVTGLVLTKLDGSAKGGFVFAVQERTGIPVKLVGTGEGIGDLTGFTPHAFVAQLLA